MRHIPRERQAKQVSILKDALAPGGGIFMYEFNPYNPVAMYYYLKYDCRYDSANVKIMSPSYSIKLFKDAGFRNVNIKYRFFIPGFMKQFIFLEKYLKKVPFGANYYLYIKN